MKAAILNKIRDLRIIDIPKPKMKKGQALIKVKSVGVCGSDVHYFTHGRIGSQVVTKPHILGHELAGEVMDVGKNELCIKKGMKVAIEPGISCGKCEHCLVNRPNCCPNVVFLGTPPVNGAYLEYMSYPLECLFPLPKNVSYDEGALLEPLTVGMYSCNLANLREGADVAILGFGPIGISVYKSVMLKNPGRIFVSDLVKERVDYANKQKNVIAVNAKHINIISPVKERTKGRGVDAVFECAGAQQTVAQSVELARIGGIVIWTGIPSEDSITINPHIARRKELVIKCDRRAAHMYPKAIEAVASGAIKVKDMATHSFKLKDITQAFDMVEHYKDGVIKAMIHM